MSADLYTLFTRLPDFRPYQGPEPDALTNWLGRRANSEWKAMPASRAIIKAARERMAQVEARRAVVSKGRG